MTKVLIVEDDSWQLEHYRRVLSRRAYDVHTCAHALDAIDVIDELQPDAVVMDVRLPSVNAFGLLHELQSHADLARIPVVLMTTQAELANRNLSHYGVREVLDKSTMQLDDMHVALQRALA